MALVIIYLAGMLWFQIMLVNEMEKRTEKLKREVESIRDSIVSIDNRIEEIEQDIIATKQIAMNAQSIAKTNSKRLDRSVVYEHR